MRPLFYAVATFVGFALLTANANASGEALSKAERERLERGGTVVRTQSVERGERRYVGGVAYAIVDAPASDLASWLANVETWRRILPKTRSARYVGSAEGDLLIEMTHGTALMQASYTMRLHREGDRVRFWMDVNRKHDIEDAWGFLRAEAMPGGRALITYGVLIDMGPGLLRDLFENRVRELALSVPDRVRTFVVERNAAGQRASR